ncbi:hypothetical protein EA462_14200 [Natrarchaeobius halalkaliphilus]|uniref:Gp5/Type VI secretion system Vgr protein OB-fold domain-containing protein n=1 Tax=Natrarchaeobius halalkaliphilus TaxID=1679091 RepID=A0A3N6MT90_9EURY|nr:phage baseplate assembly protein V [Natrarchaeobius halalkaliphilus]RQG88005.1 hypothetical protein EA462_14200 [Natrarchaeobius halalkaliphilus]
MFETPIDDDSGEAKLYGVHSATVVDTDDPEDKSRVQVNLNNREDPGELWARVARFMAGDGFGSHFQPDTGAEVLVTFENADLDGQPFVVGSLHNEGENLIDDMRKDVERFAEAYKLGKMMYHSMSSEKESPKPDERMKAVRSWADYIPFIANDANKITTKTGSELAFANMYPKVGPGYADEMIQDIGEKVAEGERMVASFDANRANFEIDDVSVDPPATEGELLEVTATVVNTGSEEATQSIGLNLLGEQVDDDDLELEEDEEDAVTFEGVFDPDTDEDGTYEVSVSVFSEDDSKTTSFEVEAVDDDDNDDDGKASDDIKGATGYLDGSEVDDAITGAIGSVGDASAADSVGRFMDTTEISGASNTLGGLDDWVGDPGAETGDVVSDLSGFTELSDVPGVTPKDTPNLSSIALQTQAKRGLGVDDLIKTVSLSDPLKNSVSLTRTGVSLYTKKPGTADVLDVASNPMNALKEAGGGQISMTAHGDAKSPLRGEISMTATDGDQGPMGGTIDLSTTSSTTQTGGEINLTCAKPTATRGGDINLTAGHPQLTASGNIEIKSNGITISADSISIEATKSLDLSAPDITIDGQRTTINGTKQTTVKGKQTTVQGDETTVKGKQSATVEAKTTTVEGQNTTVDGAKSATVKGKATTVEGRTSATVKGKAVTLDGKMTTVKAKSAATIDGQMVTLKGKNLVKAQAPLIKLN